MTETLAVNLNLDYAKYAIANKLFAKLGQTRGTSYAILSYVAASFPGSLQSYGSVATGTQTFKSEFTIILSLS